MNRRMLTEREISQTLLDDFVVEGSLGQQLIERLTGGKDLRRESLVTLTSCLSVLIDSRIPRDYRRRKSLLVKWLDTHYHQIAPFLRGGCFTLGPLSSVTKVIELQSAG